MSFIVIELSFQTRGTLVHMDQHEKLTFHPFSVISEYDLDPNCGSYPKFCNKNSLMGGCSLHKIVLFIQD